MKLTKRMKNAIIQAMVANIIFLLILGWAILFFVIPRVQIALWLRDSLEEVYANYDTIEKSWIQLQELRAMAMQKESSSDAYTSTLLRNVTPQFYNSIFLSNTSWSSYEEFLQEIKKNVFEIKASDEYIKKDKTLSSILPIYTQDSAFSKEGLTDFAFVNYIENLLYDFNLTANGEIWIGILEKVGGATEEVAPVVIWEDGEEIPAIPTNTLEEDIFKIPLSFEITWQKSDVVDFIHFFENVGSIAIKDAQLEIYNDKFISKSLNFNRNAWFESYNIYEKQIADISSVSWEEYPDSSTYDVTQKGLIALMKSDQARERVAVEIKLDFYVSGVPGYRMEQYIQELISDFNKMLQEVWMDAKKYTSQAYKFNNGEQLQAITQLQNLDTLLIAQQENIKNLQMELMSRVDIQMTYETSISQREMLDWIIKTYNAQKEILDKQL